MKPLRALDICCGAGGWLTAARGLPIEFIAVADRAADCLETVEINHAAEHPDCALIQCDLSTPEGMDEVLAACAGGIDLIVGGIPCEQVSNARGNRPLKPGELEKLHVLIDQTFRAIATLRPRFWVIEDVEAIVTHLPPAVAGVNYEVRTIDAADYGPQRRKRVFFGVYPWPIAEPEPGPRTLGEVLRPGPYRTLSKLSQYKRTKSKWYGGAKVRVQDSDRAAATVISASNGRSNERGIMVEVSAQGRTLSTDEASPAVTSSYRCDERLVRVLDTDESCPTVASFNGRHERGALVPARFGEESVPGPEDQAHTVRTGRGREAAGRQPPSIQSRPQVEDGPSATVTGRQGSRPVELRGRERPTPCDRPGRTVVTGHKGEQTIDQEGLLRVLEWQEAALLQGFPADYIFAAIWSRTWKMVAQAIPIQVGKAILKAICAAAAAGGKRR